MRAIARVSGYLILAVVAGTMLLPFLWMVSTAFMGELEVVPVSARVCSL